MSLIFGYTGSSYSPVNWDYNIPQNIYLKNGNVINKTTTLPRSSTTLPLIAEQIAVSMLGAAQSEYTVLKEFGYETASQIPPNMTLPTINLNIGNFSNFSSSLQAYNLYLALYTRELLQMEETLSLLELQGKLLGLQQLNLNATNLLSTYGQYGGFIENGSIILPNGQTLHGNVILEGICEALE